MHTIAKVRVIHNVANGPNVDVFVDGRKALGNISYKDKSVFLEVPAGKHIVEVYAGDQRLIKKELVVKAGSLYTVIAHGDVTNLISLDLLPLEDSGVCSWNTQDAAVRFIHAAALVPAVDILGGHSNVLFSNVSYGNTGNPTYSKIRAGHVSLSVAPTGTRDLVFGPVQTTLKPGKTYTILATGLLGDTNSPLDALVFVDDFCHIN